MHVAAREFDGRVQNNELKENKSSLLDIFYFWSGWNEELEQVTKTIICPVLTSGGSGGMRSLLH